MNNFYISAIYTSPPNTMGGNTKIMLEMINQLIDYYNFIIFTTEPDTFKNYIIDYNRIQIIPIQYPFEKFNLLSHPLEIKYIYEKYKTYFLSHSLAKDDIFYSCSDFAPDVLPVSILRKYYNFQRITSLYLFIPNPWKNLRYKLWFPFFKYVIYYFYQRYLFYVHIRRLWDMYFITNDDDRKYFKDNMQKRILPIYWWVNINELDRSIIDFNSKKYDAVFCSRIHPQKWVEWLIDIWYRVVKNKPHAKLALIWNWDKNYLNYCQEKAFKYWISNNLVWLWYINWVDKYKIYNNSKLFIHATVYDNNGMVAAESLCQGIPVIMYDHEALRLIYTDGCIKIKKYDQDAFAKHIILILNGESWIQFDRDQYMKIRNRDHVWIKIKNFLDHLL